MKLILILVLFISSLNMSAQSCATGNERVRCVHQNFEKEILRLTNKERKKRGLRKLKLNETLAFAARYHAKDMAVDNYFEHDTYDRQANGKLKGVCGTFERIEAFIEFPYLAENISAGKTTPKAVVDGWMKSSGHRKNILNNDYSEIGIGYYQLEDSKYQYYWVQNFGGK